MYMYEASVWVLPHAGVYSATEATHGVWNWTWVSTYSLQTEFFSFSFNFFNTRFTTLEVKRTYLESSPSGSTDVSTTPLLPEVSYSPFFIILMLENVENKSFCLTTCPSNHTVLLQSCSQDCPLWSRSLNLYFFPAYCLLTIFLFSFFFFL